MQFDSGISSVEFFAKFRCPRNIGIKKFSESLDSKKLGLRMVVAERTFLILSVSEYVQKSRMLLQYPGVCRRTESHIRAPNCTMWFD